jgi:hypothetical protein
MKSFRPRSGVGCEAARLQLEQGGGGEAGEGHLAEDQVSTTGEEDGIVQVPFYGGEEGLELDGRVAVE